MKDYIDELIEKLIAGGVATPDAIKPCTPEQIAEIEKLYSIKLPSAYRQFLLKMGAKGGRFLRGTDFYFGWLPELRGFAEELMSEWDCDFALSQTDFVFLVHQGNQFMYFDTTAGDDPPIYYYKQAEYKSQKVNDSFSNWLLCRVDEAIAMEEKIRSLKN